MFKPHFDHFLKTKIKVYFDSPCNTVVWSSLGHPLGSTQKVPCRRQCLTGGPFIHCKLAKWEQPKGALQAKVPYRGGALQGHDHCTLFVTCCRHPVYSSRTFPSTFLLFVWRQKLLICYHHFPVLARYTYLLLKDLVRYILNGDYLSRTLNIT